MLDTVRIAGAPTDHGANRRGVDMSPSAIRYADLAATLSTIGVDPRDAGNLSDPPAENDDPGEREAIHDHSIATFPISETDRRGVTDVVADAAGVAAGRDGVHVGLDLDWLDPTEAPGVGTPVRGGITYREAHAALERVAAESNVRSLELVEVNPILDDHNRTVELAASALGKRIL
jgi:arginase